jgi:chromate reductase, NAD(P)H dehydrogenase (quinone)
MQRSVFSKESFMSEVLDVVALIGSLRRESYTRRLVLALARLAPATMKIAIVEIGDLSFYNQDDEPTPPAPWVKFRERILRADAILFATTEYNRSVPAVLKNAVDVGSRPYGKSVWAGKPAAVISNSPGVMGGFGANHHLRQALVAVDMPTMQQPEAYIGGADKLFDADGEFANQKTREFMTHFLAKFDSWIRRQKQT